MLNNFNLTQKSLLYFFIASIILLVILAGFVVYYFLPTSELKKDVLIPERTMQDAIKDLTAPAGTETKSPSEEVMKSLTAPAEVNNVSEDAIESLTAPQQ